MTFVLRTFRITISKKLMIVCVCNAIRENQVREAARTGARTPAQAYARLGCKAKCGSCLPFARAIMDDERAALAANPPAAAA